MGSINRHDSSEAFACNPPRDSEENAVQLRVGSSTIGRNDVHVGMGLLSRSQTAKRRTQSKSDLTALLGINNVLVLVPLR